jgi:hypothetical protein
MHSTHFGSKPTAVPQVPQHTPEAMRELSAQELRAIGGGRMHGASPALIVDPVPPPREQN